MLKATAFVKELRGGSSLPLIIEASDGQHYVAKLNGSGDGIVAGIVDWLAIRLGLLLDLPLLQPHLLLIDASLAEQAQDPEVRELLGKSTGLNFATPYLHDSIAFEAADVSAIEAATKAAIFLYDLFLLNFDRTAKNPNMVCDKGRLYGLDYSSAITLRGVVDGRDYPESNFLPHLKRHPFYSESLPTDVFTQRMGDIDESRIRRLVDELPEVWLQQLPGGGPTHQQIGERLLAAIHRPGLIERRLAMLLTLHAETPEEERLRLLNNKKAFEAKFGKL